MKPTHQGSIRHKTHADYEGFRKIGHLAEQKTAALNPHPDSAPRSVLSERMKLPDLPRGHYIGGGDKDIVHSNIKNIAETFAAVKEHLESSKTDGAAVKSWLERDEQVQRAIEYLKEARESTHYENSDWWRSGDRNPLMRWIGSKSGLAQFAMDVDNVDVARQALAGLAEIKADNESHRASAVRFSKRQEAAQTIPAPSFKELKETLSIKGPGDWRPLEPQLRAAAGKLSPVEITELRKLALQNGNIAAYMLLSEIERRS